MAKKQIELGCKAKDTITGFTGVVTGKTTWLTGCVQWVLSPEKLSKDGGVREALWFDEGRLEVIAAAPKKLVDMARAAVATPGGPQTYPKARVG